MYNAYVVSYIIPHTPAHPLARPGEFLWWSAFFPPFQEFVYFYFLNFASASVIPLVVQARHLYCSSIRPRDLPLQNRTQQWGLPPSFTLTERKKRLSTRQQSQCKRDDLPLSATRYCHDEPSFKFSHIVSPRGFPVDWN